MRRTDWFIAVIMIAMGITCMAMSATSLGGNPFFTFGRTFIQLCMWLVGPVLILALIYLFWRKIKG